MFSTTLVIAEEQSLGIFKLNDCVNLIQTCSNCTYNNISSVIYPSGVQVIGESVMTKLGNQYNKTFCNTSKVGTYLVNGYGDLDGTVQVWSYTFKINGQGEEFTLAYCAFYIAIIAFLSFLFICCFIAINLISSSDNRSDDGQLISINNLKYIKYPLGALAWGMLVIISYMVMGLTESYFANMFLSSIFRVLFTILMISAIVGVPVIFFFMISKFIQDQVIKRMIERNIFTD